MKLFVGEIFSDKVILNKEEEHHIIKVLRMKQQDEIYVTDGKGNLVLGSLIIIGKKAEVEIVRTFPKEKEQKNRLHIAIAPTKNIDRFEFFIEKSVEMGISEITPIITANSERKLLKTDKIQKQIISACKQSLRTLFPALNPLISYKEFIEKQEGEIFIAHCYKEFEKISYKDLLPHKENITVMIGPEGDFSKEEVEKGYSSGAIGIDLGKNRLRTETAGLIVTAGHYLSDF